MWLGVVLAAIVSTAALWGGVDSERRAEGLVIIPFGWNRLIVIHAASTLILSWGVARVLSRWRPGVTGRSMVSVWIIVGLLVAAATVLAGRVVGVFVEVVDAGQTARLVVRILWCMVLQVPWCLLGLSSASSETVRPVFATGSLLGLGLLTALGVPISFLSVFAEQQTEYARASWEKEEIRDAHRLVHRLCDIGSRHSLGDRVVSDGRYRRSVPIDPRQARQDLGKNKQFREQRIAQLTSLTLTDARRLELFKLYRSLGQYSEAERTLRPLADYLPTAALRMAEIQQVMDRPEQSRQWAEKALQLAQQAEPTDEEQRASLNVVQLTAYEMLAVFAGMKADFAAAEGYLLEALQHLPTHAAYIHVRLGEHYEFIGELAVARQHQQKAAELAPDRYSHPESLLQKMLSTGAPVGLARPKSSRYQ
jgi:tetratricopeptide (TPR) repeat protein